MKLKKNIAVSETGFLFNPSSGESFAVNPIGKIILDMLSEGTEVSAIKNHILDTFLTDEDSLEKDFYDFSQMLAKFKLLDE